MKNKRKQEKEASYFLTEVLANGVVQEAGTREGQRGEIWPGCWQLKQTACLSWRKERRLGGGSEEDGTEEEDWRFL